MTPRAATPLEPCLWQMDVRANDVTEDSFVIVKENGVERCLKKHEVIARFNALARAPSSPLVGELREALGVAKGYMMNAKIDLETGAKKATALATLEGGLKLLESALARAKERG